jgi:hypothetical protein
MTKLRNEVRHPIDIDKVPSGVINLTNIARFKLFNESVLQANLL